MPVSNPLRQPGPNERISPCTITPVSYRPTHSTAPANIRRAGWPSSRRQFPAAGRWRGSRAGLSGSRRRCGGRAGVRPDGRGTGRAGCSRPHATGPVRRLPLGRARRGEIRRRVPGLGHDCRDVAACAGRDQLPIGRRPSFIWIPWRSRRSPGTRLFCSTAFWPAAAPARKSR